MNNIEKLDCERQKTNIILTLPSSDDAVESARSSLISAFVKCNPREVVTCRNNDGILCIFTALILWVRPDNLVPSRAISCLTHPSRISQLVRIDTDRLSCRLEQSAMCATLCDFQTLEMLRFECFECLKNHRASGEIKSLMCCHVLPDCYKKKKTCNYTILMFISTSLRLVSLSETAWGIAP